jgi:hypothetical protein
MTRTLLIVVALASALAVGPAGNAAAKSVSRCGPAKAMTIKGNKVLRVYKRRGDAWACSRRYRSRFRLGYRGGCVGSSSGCRSVEQIRVRGRYVAFAEQFFGSNEPDYYFRAEVRHARGALVDRFEEGEPAAYGADLKRLVLNRRGVAALVFDSEALFQRADPPPRRELWQIGTCDSRRVADDLTIEPRSIRIDDRSGVALLRWAAADGPHEETLC